MRRALSAPIAALVALALAACMGEDDPPTADVSGCSNPLNLFGCSGPDCLCIDVTLSPGISPQGLPSGSVCAPAADDGACLACVKAHCCDPGYVCGADPTCHCYVAARERGASDEAATATCGDPGSLYTAVTACTQPDCASACPGLR